MFGTDEQKQRWLAPLLDGQTRSAFNTTEPDVASSDATNSATTILLEDPSSCIPDNPRYRGTGAML